MISLAGDWLSESVCIEYLRASDNSPGVSFDLYADEILQSEEAVQDGFKITLFSAEKSLRKDYLFACARSKRSLEIRFGGINRLCSENFEQVAAAQVTVPRVRQGGNYHLHLLQLIRLTITYLVTIVQLRNEGKAND